MIDEKLLINDILQHENVLSDANYYYRKGYTERQNEIINIINRQPVINPKDIDEAYLQLAKENTELKKQLAADDWIPVEECLPEDDDYIMVSFENCSIPDIGRYDTDEDGGGAFYLGDDEKSCVSYGLIVNAWKPLPKPYRPEEDNSRIHTKISEAGKAINGGITQAIKDASDPCRNCFGAASNDCQGCWKKSMMNTFLGSRKDE